MNCAPTAGWLDSGPSPMNDAPRLLCDHERPTRTHYEILAMAWAGWVFDFYDLMLYGFLLIPLGKELGLSRLELSYVFGASLAATAAGGIFFGYLADRVGRRSVLQATIVTYSVGTVLSGLAPTFGLLMASRIVTGLGVGGEWATGQAYVGEAFPPKVRGRYAAYMQTGAPIGVALASVVGGFLAPRIGWRACFILSGLPALLVVFIRRRLPESDVWSREREAKVAAKAARGAAFKEFRELFSAQYRGLFLRCLALTLFTMSAYWFTYSWLPGYLHDERHFSMAKSAAWILVTQAGGFLGYLSFGFVADRFGRRPAFTVYSVIFAAGLLMTTLFWPLVIAHPGAVLAFMFLVGFGTGVWSGFGPLLSELFPTSIRNTAMGTVYNAARGVQFFTPVLIALVARKYGLSGGMSLAALFALAAGTWIWTFEETKGRRIAGA
jgi:MFS family permease